VSPDEQKGGEVVVRICQTVPRKLREHAVDQLKAPSLFGHAVKGRKRIAPAVFDKREQGCIPPAVRPLIQIVHLTSLDPQ
jgi:hypothetical protein